MIISIHPRIPSWILKKKTLKPTALYPYDM